jgi:hypothetical protein
MSSLSEDSFNKSILKWEESYKYQTLRKLRRILIDLKLWNNEIKHFIEKIDF